MHRPEILPELRVSIIASQNNRCFYCGLDLGSVVIRDGKEIKLRTHIDHVMPWSRTKDNGTENLVAACHVCNGIKSALTFQNVSDCRDFVLMLRQKKGYAAPEATPTDGGQVVIRSISTGNRGDLGPVAPMSALAPVIVKSGAPYGPLTQAADALWNLYALHGTWRLVSTSLPGYSQGYLFNVAMGKRSASHALLVALGLKRKLVPAQPCAACGQVHIVGWCTQLHGEPVMPKPRRPRTSLYIKDWTPAHLRYAFEHREVMA